MEKRTGTAIKMTVLNKEGVIIHQQDGLGVNSEKTMSKILE